VTFSPSLHQSPAEEPVLQPLPDALQSYRYRWPQDRDWQKRFAHEPDIAFYRLDFPELDHDLARDSRWPALFPAPLCLVTTGDGETVALEKVVGASIVNRFPYVVALSFCREALSARHYVRGRFMEMLERNGTAAVQFLAPGPRLDAAMAAIARVPDENATERVAASGLAVERGLTIPTPILQDAYLVYECRLVRPCRDFDGAEIFTQPWRDIGSHRIFYLEINAIQLDRTIADGRTPIRWRSLPTWVGRDRYRSMPVASRPAGRYIKRYTPDYVFPSSQTVAFEPDDATERRLVKHLPPLPADQVEVDNDRARWPCFFPSSLGMISTWDNDGCASVIPCGSTTIVSRKPLVVSPCISYAAINERYAPRHTLDRIRATGRFGCGVAYHDPDIVEAIGYLGNVSMRDDPNKVSNAGLQVLRVGQTPLLPALPVHFDCRVIGEERLGTHIMFFGEVERVYVRDDVSPDRPLEWCPWATI
jgi:flavin reductase (DIM6/NTAB) family NADH-FMN oxidoreductase RutF